MKKILKLNELKLTNGYLTNLEGAPVVNEAFIAAQRLVDIYDEISKNIYKITASKTAYTLDNLISDTITNLEDKYLKDRVSYIKNPPPKSGKLLSNLLDEALNYIADSQKSILPRQIRSFISDVSIINTVEKTGEIFTDDITSVEDIKIGKLYSTTDIQKIVDKFRGIQN